MSTRQASHAGSWYTSNGKQLDKQLTDWLAKVDKHPNVAELPPVQGCKAVIAPHAGYSYSGPAAAWAYKSIDVAPIKRVFLLGPSHHVYLDGCALSRCSTYATPIGDISLDLDTIKELDETGEFTKMSRSVDEDEHSLEMHLPYIRKIFEGREFKLVPIMVGAIDVKQEKSYGKLLAPYLADPETLFVVSSDFCHWGSRFRYTYYQPKSEGGSLPTGFALSSSRSPSSDHPIHESITLVDTAGMDAIKFGDGGKTAGTAHDEFAAYLAKTKNTICGRHPIGVLLAALATLQRGDDPSWRTASLQWVRYEKSSKAVTLSDSSVSYASAFVRK